MLEMKIVLRAVLSTQPGDGGRRRARDQPPAFHNAEPPPRLVHGAPEAHGYPAPLARGEPAAAAV